jgi:spermidine synthase
VPFEDDPRPVVLERATSPRGELCLRRRADQLEIISNGVFLMSTEGGGSERVLVDEALALVPGCRHLVLGGLGVGYSLARARAATDVSRITVLEVEPVVVDWHRRHFAPWVGRPLEDPRVRLEVEDAGRWLRRPQPPVDVVCLDVDNGPDWTVHDANAGLYDTGALRLWQERIGPGGVLAVWSSHAAPTFADRLAGAFAEVREVRVPAARGEDDRVYLALRGGRGTGVVRAPAGR